MAFPQSWTQRVLVTVTEKGGDDINFSVPITSVDIDPGEKEIGETPNVAGGRIKKDGYIGQTSITFKTIPLGIGREDGNDDLSFAQLFNGTNDTTQPLSTSPTFFSKDFRVVLLWTTDTTMTSATATVSGHEGYRYYVEDMNISSRKLSFTDGELKGDITFKGSVFNKSGQALRHEEETDGTVDLTALSSY